MSAASSAFASGAITRVKPAFFAAIIIASNPGMERIPPVQRELAQRKQVAQRGGLGLFVGCQQRERDGQIE
jgi:hypothetical protein